MNEFEYNYKRLLEDILDHGRRIGNRTHVDTYTCNNKSLTFDCKASGHYRRIPVITGKQVFFDKAYAEFEWIWGGHSDIAFLNNRGIYWWDQYAVNGVVEKSYGYQMRNYNGHFDQIKYVLKEVGDGSRRAHLTFWNPSDLKTQVLPCCYTGMTFTRIENRVHMDMYFRSSDVFLGLPYDIIVGYLFLYVICMNTGFAMGNINYHLANAHIYVNHGPQVSRYLDLDYYRLPYYYGGSEIYDYEHGPYIKAKLNN